MVELIITLITFFLIIRNKKESVLTLFIAFTLYDIMRGYVVHNSITANYRYVLFFIVFFSYYSKSFTLKKSYTKFLFIFYILILQLLNLLSDQFRPQQIVTSINAISILLWYFVGAKYFNSFNKIFSFHKYVIVIAYIIIFYLVTIQFIDLKLYVPDSSYSIFFKSHHFDYNIYTITFITIILFFYSDFISNKRLKLLNDITIVLCLFLLILFLKRWAIIATIIGVLTYNYYSGSIVKKFINLFKISLNKFLILVVLLSTYLVTEDTLINQYDSRSSKISNIKNINYEGRFLDYVYMKDYISKIKPINLYFGSNELWETREFGRKYLKEIRNIHPDFLALIYGTGVIGLFLYLLIYFEMISKIKTGSLNLNLKKLNSLGLAIILTLLFICIGGGTIRVNTSSSLAFFIIGGILNLYKHEKS